MRRLLKFLHEIASIGFLGAIAALLVLHASLPAPSELEQFAALRLAMDSVARWLLFPSMGLVVVSGLVSMALVPAFHSAGWVWVKLVSGLLVLEGTVAMVQAPMQKGAEGVRAALAGELSATEIAELGASLPKESGGLWFLGVIAVANVVLGVWRPRFQRRRAKQVEG